DGIRDFHVTGVQTCALPIYNALTRVPATSLLEANKHVTDLLIKGVAVDGPDGARDRTVHFIDWKTPGNNDFTVVNQFRVDIPGTGGSKSIVPDLVLFVYGIPLVVVECKTPTQSNLGVAVDQIRRNHTGNPKLFHSVQLTVATSGEDAKLGTITAAHEHYVPWRDPYPLTMTELATRRKK